MTVPPQPTMAVDAARSFGRALRQALPRSAHAELTLTDRDPADILDGQDRTRRQGLYHWRVLRGLEGSSEPDRPSAAQFGDHVSRRGVLLAQAHAHSPWSGVLSGQLGKWDALERAVSTWAQRYADQVERDSGAVEKAGRTGRLPVLEGV